MGRLLCTHQHFLKACACAFAHTPFVVVVVNIIWAGLELSTLFQPLEHKDFSLPMFLVPSHPMSSHLISKSFCIEENGARRLAEVTS